MKIPQSSLVVRAAIAAAAILIWGGSAHAAALPNPASVGVHAGTGILGDGGGAQFDLGVDGSYVLNDPFFLAAGFSWINQGSIQNSAVNASGSLYLLHASLNMDGSRWIPNTFFGVALGLAFNHTSVTAGGGNASNTDTNVIVGPRAGYDYPLSTSFTIGGEGDWFINTGSANPNVLQLVAVLKYWF